MVQIARWQIILVLAVCVGAFCYAAPNVLSRSAVLSLQNTLPSFLPSRQISLGLDLQGGVHLLMRVEYETVVDERLERFMDTYRSDLEERGIVSLSPRVSDGTASLELEDPTRSQDAVDIGESLANLDGSGSPFDFVVEPGGRLAFAFTEDGLTAFARQLTIQAIEVVRRRIDQLGTTEPTIQRQGDDRLVIQVPGLDDPERLKIIVGQTARLTFHLAQQNLSPAQAQDYRPSAGMRLLPDIEQDDDGNPARFWVVSRRTQVSGDNLTDAQPAFDRGVPVVRFTFDSVGGRRFGELTADHVGEQLGIVLDDQIVSAPVIRTAILGGSGIITGSFTTESANDLSIMLRSGALPANLVVIEERTVGPSLGADSIAAGKLAAIIGFALVVLYMALNYGRFGLYAALALITNLLLILAVLTTLGATLTLPGIAGIVLTVGMAVDANVLIFERIREEIRNGRTPISAIDAGYSRAMGTIIDSNVTTLIAAVLLFGLGAGPIRGFAITLSIGILSSMFTAIMVTRLLVVLWLRRTMPKSLAF